MKCIDLLMDEHQKILEELRKLERVLEDGVSKNILKIKTKIEFIQKYADGYHHSKEEEILFKWMIKKNPMFVEGGPVNCMLKEHEQGRDYVNSAKKALRSGDDFLVKENLTAFMELLRDHINKEDTILYKMAKSLDDGYGDEEMMPLFLKIKKENFSKVEHLL